MLEHPFSGLLLSNEKGCRTDTRNIAEESQKQDVKERKPGAYFVFHLYDILETARQRGQKTGKRLPGAGKGSRTTNGDEGAFSGHRNALHCTVGLDS